MTVSARPTRPPRRSFAPQLALLALPFVMGSTGHCGIAFDFTETFLVTDPVDSIVIVVDDGNIDAVAYDRDAIMVKRHTWGFEKSIGKPEFSVEDGVMRFEAHCKHRGECTFDHMLELPLGVAFDITMLDARIDIGYVDSDITATFESGYFKGVRLAAPQVTLAIGAVDVDLDYAVAPQLVTIDVDEGDVAIAVPLGEYRCTLDAGAGQVTTSGITCNDAAVAVLDVHVASGDITVTEAAP